MTVEHPGFRDPVGDSQSCFRAVLDATAHPGSIHALSAPPGSPKPLDPATAAVLLTLVDGETPLWLDPAAVAARDWITFHCGAPLVSEAAAVYALAFGPVRLASFGTGTDDQPELGATLILQVRSLADGARLVLSGPGLAAPAPLRVDGLPPGFVAQWDVNHALFPRGVDLILCAGDRLAALPRSLRIEEG